MSILAGPAVAALWHRSRSIRQGVIVSAPWYNGRTMNPPMNKIQYPALNRGQTYRREEVEVYIALQGVQDVRFRTDDYSVAISGFPHRDRRRGLPDLELWEKGQGRSIVIEYDLFQIEQFASWFDLVRSNLAQGDNNHRATSRQKVDAIKERLTRGEPAFPVWIEKHLVGSDPMAVSEGNHRLLAFAELQLTHVPVFLLKYADPV